MGGLAHYFEEEGIPTTQISLIREHTQIIRPPRALWVPFELGRPLGLPSNEKFQIRVLEAALKLFEAKKGPVLKEFPEDAPVLGSADAGAVWACPINLSIKAGDLSKTDQLILLEKGVDRLMQAYEYQRFYFATVTFAGRSTLPSMR